MNNQIAAFVAELIKRLFAKSPKFFKVIQVISIVLAIVTGVPEILAKSGVVLPEALQSVQSSIISIASFAALVVASLTVDKGIGAKQGIQSNESLPFTAKAEERKIEKIIEKDKQ